VPKGNQENVPPKKAKKARKATTPEVEAGSVDELTRMLALTLKYEVPQGVLVHDLSKAGFSPKRIAELLGTTANTVSQAKRAKRPKWPK
jgi:hypothetical protein